MTAILALTAGIAPNIPGFLGTIKVLDAVTVGPFWMHLYNYSWFVGFGVAFAVYGVLRAIKPLHNHSTSMTR